MQLFRKIISQSSIVAIFLLFIPLILISIKIYHTIAFLTDYKNFETIISKTFILAILIGFSYAISIAILILVIYLLMRKYIGPLDKVLQASKQLASGKIPAKLKITYKDEVGELARSTNNIRDRIQYSSVKLQNSYQREQKSKTDAEEANSQKVNFLYKVSKELRTPLTPILSYSNLIIAKINEGQYDEDLDRKIRIIRDCADNLLNITSNINEISKFQTGDNKLNESNFDTIFFIEELIKLHHFSAKHNSIKLKCIYPKDFPKTMNTDKEILFHILSNILTYAIQYSPKNTDIKLSVESTSYDNVLFTIQDSTAGTQADIISHIFELSSNKIIVAAHYLSNAKLFGIVSAIANAELLGSELIAETVKKRGTAFKLSIKNVPSKNNDTPLDMFNI
ncbi:MAG: HAMP domain-containing histidine kinase [bacterium]|nr:HAMP domain-containing histidine kinase [bacterium]